jgi:hypothetical protein
MTKRIDNANSPAVSSERDGTVPRQDLDVGLWRGAPVQVAVEPFDILTDAAEEITFAHCERVESHKLDEARAWAEPQPPAPKSWRTPGGVP